MASDELTLMRETLQAAGFKPTDKDMQQFEQMRLRRQPPPVPALSAEPWSLPQTRRWRNG